MAAFGMDPALIASITRSMTPDKIDAAAAALAQAGAVPPPKGSGAAAPGGLASILDPQTSPLTGITAPAAPPVQIPGAPGAPSPSQAITNESALLEMLMKGAPQTAAPQSLGALLGR